jgi:integrase
LHKALADAVAREILLRNPASLISPPKVERTDFTILSNDQIQSALNTLYGNEIYPHVVMLLSTGMRRGELMALQWGDIDLDAGKMKIDRSVEVTRAKGLRIKPPKTHHGRRVITLPPIATDTLRAHRKAQLELRVKLGIGKLLSQHYVFGDLEGLMRHPDWITYHWKRFAETQGFPDVTLHALRHSHASALIASGQDVVTVSRRLGHASPTITLSVYAHLFDKTDEAAATAIEAVLKPTKNKS